MLTQEQINLIGSVEFFDIKPFIDAANILVAADEPMRALQLLDNLPAYYRDHYPIAAQELKRKIYSLLATPAFYATNPYDQLVRVDNAHEVVKNTLRGNLIQKDLEAFNEKNQSPHIIDLGPGEYWLPIGLKKLGFKFTYQDIGLCNNAKLLARPHLEEEMRDKRDAQSPVIFVACEIIEHLHHEADIRVDLERTGHTPDIIHISTPRYTFDGRASQLDWQKKGDLGHLRTYTPREFHSVVTKMFPEYTFNLYDSQIMHLRGVRNN